MSHMERLRHIGPAVVDHDLLFLLRRLQAELRLRRHGLYHLQQIRFGKLQIQEARRHRCRLAEHPAALQLFCNFPCNGNGRFFVLFCPGHGAVALVFAKVGAV